MSEDNVEYLVIDYDDQLDSVVDSVNYLLQDYGLVFEEDDDKNNESYENGDGRMWWVLVDKSLKRICEHCDGYGGQGDGYVPEQKGMLPSMCGYCDGKGVDK